MPHTQKHQVNACPAVCLAGVPTCFAHPTADRPGWRHKVPGTSLRPACEFHELAGATPAPPLPVAGKESVAVIWLAHRWRVQAGEAFTNPCALLDRAGGRWMFWQASPFETAVKPHYPCVGNGRECRGAISDGPRVENACRGWKPKRGSKLATFTINQPKGNGVIGTHNNRTKGK